MQGSYSFFTILRHLPLFQGLSSDDLSEIVEKTAITFSKAPPGSTFIKQDTQCTHLTYAIRGSLTAIRHSYVHAYSIEEHELHLPMVIEPEMLMGIRTIHTHTYRSSNEAVQLLSIDKHTVMHFLQRYDIFRLNYINNICHKQQHSYNLLWNDTPDTIVARFITFLLHRVLSPAGQKVIHIDMKRLAEELCCTRRTISAMLHSLADAHLLTMGRKTIHIPHMEKLTTL